MFRRVDTDGVFDPPFIEDVAGEGLKSIAAGDARVFVSKILLCEHRIVRNGQVPLY